MHRPIPFDVEPVDDDKISNINVLLYGRPGVGKAYFAGQGLNHGKRAYSLIPQENIGSAARGNFGQTNVAKITSWRLAEG